MAPCFHTEIPIRKRGLTRHHFHMGTSSVTNPFPNRVHAHLGIEEKIPIWECFPYGDCGFHMVIRLRKPKKFPFGDSLFPNRVCAHFGINIYVTPHMVTNSFQEQGLPIWEIFMVIPIWLRGSPYGNVFYMGFFTDSPYGHKLFSETG
jgi:hypothetical protein